MGFRSTNTRSVDYFEFAERHCETLDGCSSSTRRTEYRMVKGKIIVDRNWEQGAVRRGAH